MFEEQLSVLLYDYSFTDQSKLEIHILKNVFTGRIFVFSVR